MARSRQTVRAQIAVCYANLARAHSALERRATCYSVVDHMIRARLQRGLLDGTMRLGPLYDDERMKMTIPQACCYCGATEELCLDHLVPKARGGAGLANNLVWACRGCNSSKGGRDLLQWMLGRNRFPAVLLLRRYVKLVSWYCESRGQLDLRLDCLDDGEPMPFDVRLLPTRFPPLAQLELWVLPSEAC